MNEAEARIVEALYAGVTDAGEIQRALALTQAMLDCRAGVIFSLDAQMPSLNIGVSSGALQDHERLYTEQFASIDPAPAIFSAFGAGTASTSDRVFDAEMRRTNPFLNEFFVPLGLVETIAGPLFSEKGRFSLIGLQRGPDRPPFENEDVARLERLMPHITRALQLRRSFSGLKDRNTVLEAAIDRLPAGLVLLGPEGTILFVNAAMRAIAGRADGLGLDRRGRPVPASLAARRSLDSLLHDVASGGAGGVVPIPRPSGLRAYIALVAPSPRSLVEFGEGRSGAVVIVHDPTDLPREPPALLEDAFRLPRGAARLVAALAADEDLKGFAEREGVTIHTARFHLRTALARTGTRNQAELVRLAVRFLRDAAMGTISHRS